MSSGLEQKMAGARLSPHWLTKRVLIPVSLALLLLVAVAAAIFVYFIQDHMQSDLAGRAQAARGYWQLELDQHAGQLNDKLAAAAEESGLVDAVAAMDREALVRIGERLHAEMSRRNGALSLAFLDREQRLLLRLPESGADAEPVHAETEQSIRLESGLVFTRFGLRLRAVLPLWQEGRRIGYLAMAEGMEHPLEYMDRLFAVQHITAIDRAYLAGRGLEMPLGLGEDRQSSAEHVLFRRNIEIKQAVLDGLLRQSHEPGAGRLIAHDGRHYFAASLPLDDARGDHIGHIALFYDVTQARETMVRTIGSVLLAAALLWIGLFILLYRLTRKTETDYGAMNREVVDSRQAWKDAFDAIEEPIFLHDREFRVLRANRAYAEVAGKPFSEILGRPYWLAFPAGDGPLPGCQAALVAGSREAHEEEIRLPDGRHFISRSFYTAGNDEQYRYSVHVFSDMTAIEQALADVRHENRLHRTISASNRSLIRAASEEELLAAICAAAVDEAGFAEAGVVYAGQDAKKSLRLMACAGPHCEELRAMPLSWDQPAGTSAAAEAVRSGNHCVLHDLRGLPEGSPNRLLGERFGYRSEIGFPLMEGERVFGAFIIAAREAHAFNDVEINLLDEMAGDLAYGIVSLRADARRRQADRERLKLLAELETSLDKTVMAMARALEVRDPYTSGHQQRVAELAEAIAREMGMEDGRVQGIRIAGIVHDIGKIGVPAEMLSKPGRLTEVEFAIIKTHPQVGYDILKDIDFPWPVAKAVWQHHERLDGSGYPAGLKGDEIIPEARILTVADMVEAIVSHRPYRPGHGLEKALAIIEEERGTQLDPEVVDACLRLFREKRFNWR